MLLCQRGNKKSLELRNIRSNSGLTASTSNPATTASTTKGNSTLTGGSVAGNSTLELKKKDLSLKNEEPNNKIQSNNAFSNPIVTNGSGKINTSAVRI